ncbi:DUF4386 domain-containing protein [Microbacterium paludicola]|uniref:DUF4386 domain-containing protein n=1 Tax=Microbacterium paludicola TaxID=300019 RepID=UPI0038793516
MTRSPMLYARTAGALYLVTHVTAVGAAAAYTAPGTVRLGVALEFLLAVGCLGTGLLLWRLLQRHGPVRAAAFGTMRAVEAAVILAASVPMLALAVGASWGTPLGDALTQVHAAGFLIGQGLIISINTLVLGWLLLDARVVPRALAVLGLVGGGVVLTGNALQLFGLIPLAGAIAGITAVPIFAFEIWFALHLLIRGLHSAAGPDAPAAAERMSPATSA